MYSKKSSCNILNNRNKLFFLFFLNFSDVKSLIIYSIYIADGPAWAWVMLNLLPIDELLQYTALASRSFRIRLQMISDAMDFALNQQLQQQQTTVTTEDQT